MRQPTHETDEGTSPPAPERDRFGRFAKGNGAALRHGVRRFQASGVLTPDVRAGMDAFEAGILADRGGEGEVTILERAYIARVAQLHAVLELVARDFQVHGIVNPKGRVRSIYRIYVDTLAAFDRYASKIGLGRRARQVESLADILKEHADRPPAEATSGNGDGA